jgi:hypothetical protein
MNMPVPFRMSGKKWALLAIFLVLIGAGALSMEARKSEKMRLSCLFSVNEMRLETRARLHADAPGTNGESPFLADLGFSPDTGFSTEKYIVWTTQDESSHAVNVRVCKPGRPETPLLEVTYPWREWIGEDFEFAWP